jgi:2-polyprenyl-3-methyl-5-hydroxy-6-metoxy-1,4-benzoquinol methylase
MSDNQNEFYSSISKYYSEIFPYNPIQLKFVLAKMGDLSGQQILDIGCATGELAFRLANSGAKVTGIDLNEDLLNQAIGFQSTVSSKSESEFTLPNPKFKRGNMLELASDFQSEQFDAVLCFGNTVVHLETETLVLQMLKAAKTVLKSGGQFLIQILNYDYIVGQQLSSLPLIETENIKFIRKYKFQKDSSVVRFQTNLEIKSEGKTVSNDTALLALKSANLIDLLKLAGFKNIQLYANFKQDVFGGLHIPLVLSCEK